MLRHAARFHGFHDLIRHRVREILLVSTAYDAFVLEEDRNLSERLFSEYVDLDLRFVPRIMRVSTGGEALSLLRRQPYSLVLAMSRLPDMTALAFRTAARAARPDLHLAFLTYDALDTELRGVLLAERSMDRVYYWLRDTRILLSIVKQVEDEQNVQEDTAQGVQVLLLVEDTPRYYSLLLPLLYTEVFTQTRRLISESVNDYHRLLRMRARPKILLAESYESAVELFERYRSNVIGVVSDLRYPRNEEPDPEAGMRFGSLVRAEMPDVPVLIQSSELDRAHDVSESGFAFAHKDSTTLSQDIRSFLLENCGFGDFVFRDDQGAEVWRASNLSELLEGIRQVPDEVLTRHTARNHISIWLRARTEFHLAELLRPKRESDHPTVEAFRAELVACIDESLHPEKDGIVREFSPRRFSAPNKFIRIGGGSLGGKGRGLAFVNSLLARNVLRFEHEKLRVRIPDTFVLGTEVFERFLDENDLWELIGTHLDDSEIAARFLAGTIPEPFASQIATLVERVRHPLAVRSSSLLEDNQAMPFAGLYRTYMLANRHQDILVRQRALFDAIRLVWASLCYRGPREYIKNTGYRIDEERMAVVLQELAGTGHGALHYPTLSGVARSYSFYPFPGMRPEEGTVSLALGLGRAIVDNERVYHFCPAHPEVDPPYASAEDLFNNCQSHFYALDLDSAGAAVSIDENYSLRRLSLSRAERDGVIQHLASTWCPEENAIRDHTMYPGPRVLRFAPLLKYKRLPLVESIRDLLRVGAESFGSPVEIEFSAEIPSDSSSLDLQFLQIRPMATDDRSQEIHLEQVTPAEALCLSTSAMGNGRFLDIHDIVFADPGAWNILHTRVMARELEDLNRAFEREGRRFVLIGFGRWATSDPSLGVPVCWEQVSQARVFVEADRPDLWVEPSQGSHFFQNMLALRIGYLFVKQTDRRSHVDWDWLLRQEPRQMTPHFRHLRFSEPVVVEVDGRSSRGVVRFPSV